MPFVKPRPLEDDTWRASQAAPNVIQRGQPALPEAAAGRVVRTGRQAAVVGASTDGWSRASGEPRKRAP
jgi:hypothetical protein